MTLTERLRETVAGTLRLWSSLLADGTASSHQANGTSTPPTPQPSTPVTEALVLAMTQMMTTWAKTNETQAKENRELILSILQGRPTQTTTTGPVLPGTVTLSEPNYDDDSIPLPGGIELVLAREGQEEEDLRRLRMERADLAAELARVRSKMPVDPRTASPESSPTDSPVETATPPTVLG